MMDAVREALLSEKRMVCAGLRQWPATVEGPDADFNSAAVELVISAFDGSLADPGWPWVREADELGCSGSTRSRCTASTARRRTAPVAGGRSAAGWPPGPRPGPAARRGWIGHA